MLCVGYVEYFPTQRQLLFFAPGHRKNLAEAHVEIYIARRAQDIALSCFARIRGAVTLVCSDGVAPEELWRIVCVAASRAGRHVPDHSHVALHLPVCGPLACIVRLAIWKAGVPPVDSRKLPTADKGVQTAAHDAAEA